MSNTVTRSDVTKALGTLGTAARQSAQSGLLASGRLLGRGAVVAGSWLGRGARRTGAAAGAYAGTAAHSTGAALSALEVRGHVPTPPPLGRRSKVVLGVAAVGGGATALTLWLRRRNRVEPVADVDGAEDVDSADAEAAHLRIWLPDEAPMTEGEAEAEAELEANENARRYKLAEENWA